MSAYLNNFKHLLTTLALTICIATPAWADDTEVFTGVFDMPGDPNIMIIIDTSGSMNGSVAIETNFDTSTPYTGACNTNRYYWQSGNSVPDCTTSSQWFVKAALVCDFGDEQIDEFGFYKTRYAQWNDNTGTSTDQWLDLSASKQAASDLVECQDDFGVHGDGSSTTETYPGELAYGPFYDVNNKKRVVKWNGRPQLTLYDGNYINYLNSVGGLPGSKLEVVQVVAKSVLATVSGVNVGLMRFDKSSSGGMVLHEIASLASNRAAIDASIDSLKPNGNTPTSETLYEAYTYFAGIEPKFGLDTEVSGGCAWGTAGPNHCPSVPASIDTSGAADVYISPIDETCDRNFIIYLSDGDAVSDSGADAEIQALSGTSCSHPSDNCTDELAGYMNNNDVNASIAGEQTVRTYTIGFDGEHEMMEATAEAGGGTYFRADNMAELTLAFEEIFQEISEIDFTFVSPTVSVNTFSRFTHNSELYYTVYRPTLNPSWPGNLKKYALGYVDGELTVLDANNNEAIDNETGFFRESAKSFWTQGAADGFDTTLGGFASRLEATRNIYMNFYSSWPLTHVANKFHEDNPRLTHARLGTTTAAERTALLEWARGVDSSGNPLNELSDALHSKPVILSWGGTVDDPDLTLFYTTNTGFLHAVDVNAGPADPLEEFSFIGVNHIPYLKTAYDNVAGSPDKLYTADGPITAFILDDDGDAVVEPANGEQALVYYGERRGGRGYRSLDVTDRAAPLFNTRWTNSTTGLSELGYTWSKLTPAKVILNGTPTEVLFVAGGYDTAQDDVVPATADSMGRAIYMLDPVNYANPVLWTAANGDDYPGADLPLADMDYSIPSDLSVLDKDGDGYADTIFVGDTGAQIWRFDIDNAGNTGASDFATGGVIADFGGTATPAERRRFYYPPSVSQFVSSDHGNFLALAIGSGHRANPLGTSGSLIEDRIYMLKQDMNVSSYTTLDETDLLDITADVSPDASDLVAAEGWFIALRENEKVINNSFIADNRIFINSYIPDASGSTTCDPAGAVGSGFAYQLSIAHGAPARNAIPLDEDGDGELDIVENGEVECLHRCTSTAMPLPPEPILVFIEPDPESGSTCNGFAEVATLIGSQVSNPDICTTTVKTYWVEDD